MSGSSLNTAWVPLADGAEAVYNSSGLAYDRHPDWLGSSRLASTASRGLYFDTAYSPYGNPYAATTGNPDYDFTGQNADTVNSGSEILYDYLFRDLSPLQGRWLSPDPIGLGAVNPENPQSWNRYDYVMNNPVSNIDMSGLDEAIHSSRCANGWVDITTDSCYVWPSYGEFYSGPYYPIWLFFQYNSGSIGQKSKLPLCKNLSLNDPSVFWNNKYATPNQVEAFFQSVNAPEGWNGFNAAQDFIGKGINPGVAVGIIGAETFFGGGPQLTAGNVNNPFSCDSSSNFNASAICSANTVAHDEAITYTPNTPLSALENEANPLNRQYSATQSKTWLDNVNAWFKKLAKYLGKCR